MKLSNITVVRVYITEKSKKLHLVEDYLQKTAKITGYSVFRAISGYGSTGEHTASFVDTSLDLPLVIEFFDIPEKTEAAITYLHEIMNVDHVICWSAQKAE